MSERFFKVCPRCGSLNTKFNDRQMDGGPLWDKCLDCTYGESVLVIFPEVEESRLEEFKAEREKE
ncbi:MAG: hypothetical protein ACLFO2_03690 [Candidatus Woesearchaeota archaeon]